MRGASRRGYEHSTRVPPAVEQEDGAGSFGRDEEFVVVVVVGGTRLGWLSDRKVEG